MQDKSAGMFSLVQRLEKLRVVKQMTWVEIGELLGLSDSMLYQVRRGTKQLSDKAVHRLEMAEKEMTTNPHDSAPVLTGTQADKLNDDEKPYGAEKEPGLKEALQALNSALDLLKTIIENQGKEKP